MKRKLLLAIPLLGNCGLAKSQTWDCRLLGSERDQPLVSAVLNSDQQTGRVSLVGTAAEYDARHEFRGFDRWWSFNDDGGRAYALLMRPDGFSFYYDLTGRDFAPDTPSQVYLCRERGQGADESDDLHVREHPVSAEQEARREAEARKQAQLEAELAAASAVEDEARRAEEAGLLDPYLRAIHDQIQRKWNPPLSARAGLECVINVTQIPSGHVTAVSFGQCNGDDAVKRSIEAAVQAASPLPRPPVPSLFNRTIAVTFKPEV